MKRSFYLLIFITFATIITSLFASCGDSEIFDEPTMYRTKAMTRMDTRSEPIAYDWFVVNDSSFTEERDLGPLNVAIARVTLEWDGNDKVGNSQARMRASCEIEILDSTYFLSKKFPVVRVGEPWFDEMKNNTYYPTYYPTVIFDACIETLKFNPKTQRNDTVRYHLKDRNNEFKTADPIWLEYRGTYKNSTYQLKK